MKTKKQQNLDELKAEMRKKIMGVIITFAPVDRELFAEVFKEILDT